MKHRMAVATLALLGFFVALYLWLWKMGFMGEIACGTGGCEAVQLSGYATFLGLPVAVYGVIGYPLLLGVSIAGLQPRWLEEKWPTIMLVGLSGIAVLFTAYLTFLEAAVIRAWCRWCIGSAVLILAIFVVSVAGLWETSKPA